MLTFNDFKQKFSHQLNTMTGTFHEQNFQWNSVGCFYQGANDALNIISQLYGDGKLELTFKSEDSIGINNIFEYIKECEINEDVELDEFEYPLLARYYYSGVNQILGLLNRDFKVKYQF